MKKTAVEYSDIVNNWNDVSILVLGDAMVDEYIFGNANRISPEAPVPVVHAKQFATHLGGACNVAKNIKALGGKPILFSFMGDDAYASMLQVLLQKEDISSYLYTVPDVPTTVKTRVLADKQHIVRIDREDVALVPEDIVQKMIKELRRVASSVDVIVYSDYAKGFFTSYMIQQLHAIWDSMEHKPLILVDPKVSNINLFQDVFLVTPNSKETEESTGVSIADNVGLQKAASILFEKCKCKHVLTTLGARGMALFLSETIMEYIPAIAQDVFDVTGAGDAVIATLAMGLANKTDIVDSVWLANCSGAYSVRHVGVVSVTKKDILETISLAFSVNNADI